MKIEKNKIFQIGEQFLNGRNLEFFQRVWSSDFNNYITRIKALKISGCNRVLDAGCGFGQWSLSMALFNNQIFSIDISKERIEILNKIIKSNKFSNIKTSTGSIQELNFENNYFDYIFCYSSIYYTDFKKTIKEFFRVLKPNGKLYISTNGIGWYLHNLIDGHNSSKNFNSKRMAIETFENTINFYEKTFHQEGKQIVIPSEILKKTLFDVGFKNLIKGSDGDIILDKSFLTESFYPKEYHGVEGVYEILAYKDDKKF